MKRITSSNVQWQWVPLHKDGAVVENVQSASEDEVVEQEVGV